jgi:hypothetical protein
VQWPTLFVPLPQARSKPFHLNQRLLVRDLLKHELLQVRYDVDLFHDEFVGEERYRGPEQAELKSKLDGCIGKKVLTITNAC